jgi:phage tail sheath protein FI
MPSSLTYPGVYVEEIASGVRTITGVATSITAFIGRTLRGPVNEPVIVNNFGEFERRFGGLAPDHTVAYAVQDFFANGGSQALIVRLYKPFYVDDVARAAALAQALIDAPATANTVNAAASTAAALAGATAASVDAAATAAVTGAAGSAGQLAGAMVAAAAHAEAIKAPYITTSQALAISGTPTGGSFKLGFMGGVTADITWNSIKGTSGAGKTAAENEVLTKLQAVAVAPVNVASVVRSGTSPNFTFLITFGGTLATPPDQISVGTNALTGGTPVAMLLPDAGTVSAAAAAAVANASATAPGIATPLNRARLDLGGGLILEAASPGAWGNALTVTVDYNTRPLDNGNADPTLYNLTVSAAGRTESIRNVTGIANAARLVSRVLSNESSLVRVVGTPPTARPAAGAVVAVLATARALDSQPLGNLEFVGSLANKTGLYALEKADLFNLLCVPPDTRDGDTSTSVYQKALDYCVLRRAMLIVDSPAAWSANPDTAAAAAVTGLATLGINGPAARNAALFFPRILESDPMRTGQIDTFVPCGAIAGVFSRTDSTRGVWKAPAGLDANLNGITGLEVGFSDGENGQLNPLAINTLRSFPGAGHVIWGARTLRGGDSFGDEYKYVPVRRFALYLEETLYRGSKWVVFEPNDEPLWAQIRLNIGAFLHTLFRQGAFQGATPKDAYFVKCDHETTTQDDVNHGIVNIVVGFAPLKPAEFVIIKLQQIAGQIQT